MANCLGLTPLEIAFTLQDPDVVGALLQGGSSTGKLRHWKDLSWATEKPWFPLFKFRTQDYHPIPCEGTHDVDYSKHYSHSVKKSLILRNWQPQDDSDPYLKAVIEDKLCKMVFTIRSHDQGWSDERDGKGTYAYSYTWFEAGGWQQGRTINRRVIQHNVQASSQWCTHVITWDVKQATEDLREWLESFRPGDALCVYARAKYPAWTNYVESAQVDIYTTPQLSSGAALDTRDVLRIPRSYDMICCL